MHFDLVDHVLERTPERITTLKLVSAAEEYLQDHFATFPVLPGVMMLEAMVQAGRRLLESRGLGAERPLVLGKVRALKYGKFVKPGAALRVEVVLHKQLEGGEYELKGEGTVIEPGAGSGNLSQVGPAGAASGTAVSGRFVLRPAR